MVMYKTVRVLSRGAILVKNGFVLRTPQVYSYVVNNQGKQKNWALLNFKISLFSMACISALQKLKNFIVHSVNEDSEVAHLLKSELLRVELWMHQEGQQVFSDLSSRIRAYQSRIDEDTFLNIQDVLDNHYNIAADTFGRELSLSRSEIVLDYLKELPYIIKMELDFELPISGTSIQRTMHTNSRQLFVDTYDPKKDNAYTVREPRQIA